MDSSIKRKNAKKRKKADRTINGSRFVDSSVDLRDSVTIRRLEIARTITVRNMVLKKKARDVLQSLQTKTLIYTRKK